MAQYNRYDGEFPCHTCKKIVKTSRFYIETKLLTWLCEDGHMSQVDFNKRTKKDYERKERE